MFNSAAVLVTPSRILSSAVVEVTPSKILSSAAVEVTPSKILSSAAVEVTVVLAIDNASVSSVPSTSTSPETSRLPASNSPVRVMLRKEAISLLASTTTALDAATVPAVMPSSISNSASLIAAPPTVRDVNAPAAGTAPPMAVPSIVPPSILTEEKDRLAVMSTIAAPEPAPSA